MGAPTDKTVETGVDTRTWPLVRYVGAHTTDTVKACEFIESLRRVLDRDKRFCMLVDLTLAERIDLAEIRMIADFARLKGPQLREFVTAMALVVPSPMVRGAIKVMFTLKPPEHPYTVVRDMEAGEAYIAPYLEELGSTVLGRRRPNWMSE